LLLIGFFYFGYSILNIFYWKKLPKFEFKPVDNQHFFSIIISARNEESSIYDCLQSIFNQNYPVDKFEIIVINDFSTDQTLQILQKFSTENLVILNLSDYISGNYEGGYKKKAIEIGINKSKGNWIITTDGDVVASENWLMTINAFIQSNNTKLLTGPVLFEPTYSILERFQALDFTGMMLITAAGYANGNPILCNGANLTFSKSVFYEVGGYDGNEQIPSGDDLFLLEKIKKIYPSEVHFLKTSSALIYTKPKSKISEYVQQRLRWGTKTTKLKDKSTIITLGLIWLNCLNFTLGLFLAPFISFQLWAIVVFVGSLKAIIDYVLLYNSTTFWKKRKLLRGFIISEFYHTFFTAIIGLLGLFSKKATWKSRTIRLD